MMKLKWKENMLRLSSDFVIQFLFVVRHSRFAINFNPHFAAIRPREFFR
jgi:hypothetical protein